MRLGKMKVGAALAVLGWMLCGNVVNAQTGGPASGRWARVDSANIAAQGTMFSVREKPLHSVLMRFHGRDYGTVTGIVSDLPRPGAAAFTLIGKYTKGLDGVTCFSTHMMFVVPGMNVPMMIYIGEFNGKLHPNPTQGSVDLPWRPATKGHLHGRWWHR